MALTAKDLLQTEKILTCRPEESLTSALAQMHSSHDAVFVFDRERFLGVISPYHVLYRASFPSSTKVKNCLFSPPKLKPETKIDKIARLMLESKVYFLPVISAGGKFLGIVSYRQLLQKTSELKLSQATKALITAKENVTIGQAKQLMKTQGVSRIVIINNSGRLTGILTRYDLNHALSQPQQSLHPFDRQGEKSKISHQPAGKLIKRQIITVNSTINSDQIKQLILEKQIGSVIIVNRNFKPIGIITVRDLLAAITQLPPVESKLIPQIKLTAVKSGFEVIAYAGKILSRATGKFKKQTIKKSLKKLKRRLEKN